MRGVVGFLSFFFLLLSFPNCFLLAGIGGDGAAPAADGHPEDLLHAERGEDAVDGHHGGKRRRRRRRRRMGGHVLPAQRHGAREILKENKKKKDTCTPDGTLKVTNVSKFKKKM